MDVSYIGGADGPTSILIAGQVGGNWLNIFGLIIVIFILIPNIIYAIKFKDATNKCTNKVMNILEQIGRYACMIFMVFNVGMAKFGFASVGEFLIYFFGNTILLLAYWLVWILFFVKQRVWKSMALAIIPACIFLICGVTLRHILLIVSAVVFAVGHIYVTCKNIIVQKLC